MEVELQWGGGGASRGQQRDAWSHNEGVGEYTKKANMCLYLKFGSIMCGAMYVSSSSSVQS